MRSAYGRSLLRFLLIGVALLGLRRGIAAVLPEAPPLLVVPVAAGATEAEIARAVDEALLLELAERAGWARSDTVARERLLQNLAFVEPEDADPATRLDRAIALGMHRSDPVVRSRLLWMASEVLGRLAREPASEADLAAYARAHAERFSRGAAIRFAQVFLSAERRGAALDADAAALGARLGAMAPDAALQEADPSLLPAQVGLTPELRIDALFGAGFARALSAAPVGRWHGPLRSAYGLHFVWVHERAPGELRPLESIRDEVRRAYEHDAQGDRVRAALRRMRSAYRVQIEQIERQGERQAEQRP